ncbi:pilus assembly protein [Sansalvadorimonas sp. 2012CJ34-2]|uniref:Pilus assembly protein n=1 Tax=Parendozoicomonas callyspongiae TaxID=2942213 RepID=A0ABT0PJA4_9GAMM|nr:TadE/TadG family type IV pilus assembly protein [Sansalvadorimonas sp. 2012CJ34-2]MCL6271465.1 pilus assembly protein [Sansalvadorimonas sp. 2012CJ34-2]
MRKTTVTSTGTKKQSGVAAIMFVLMLPVLLGMMALGLDSASYLHARTRLNDAVEVANLALSARGKGGQKENEALALSFIKANMQQIPKEDIDVTVRYRNCASKSSKCVTQQSSDNSDRDSIEFQLKGEIKYNPLFPGLGATGLGFSKDMEIAGEAYSRRYVSEAVDVVFVADFSFSMLKEWNGKKKIVMLKEVIDKIAADIDKFSHQSKYSNTMALVPFGGNTKTKGDPYGWVNTQLYFGENISGFEYKVDYPKIFENLFVKKTESFYVSEGGYYTVENTEHGSDIVNEIKKMSARGTATASYEGIIRAAQLAKNGTNSRRLIIVLSDGADSTSAYPQFILRTAPYAYKGNKSLSEVHKTLLDYKDPSDGNRTKNYCDYIRDELDSQTANGKSVRSKIAVIGFDYDVDQNKNLLNCAGRKNVYSAENMQDVYNRILQLISEDVGRISQPVVLGP